MEYIIKLGVRSRTDRYEEYEDHRNSMLAKNDREAIRKAKDLVKNLNRIEKEKHSGIRFELKDIERVDWMKLKVWQKVFFPVSLRK